MLGELPRNLDPGILSSRIFSLQIDPYPRSRESGNQESAFHPPKTRSVSLAKVVTAVRFDAEIKIRDRFWRFSYIYIYIYIYTHIYLYI